MTYVIDIDDTLLLYPKGTTKNRVHRYKLAYPNQEEIDIVNYLYDMGNVIILHTGRNWDKYLFTIEQLEEFKIKYHELVMGKPQGIYIDKDSLTTVKGVLNG